MMRDGGRRKQHGGYAGKAESFPGHDPLHDVEKSRLPRMQLHRNPIRRMQAGTLKRPELGAKEVKIKHLL
jgi:hypothetical protein